MGKEDCCVTESDAQDHIPDCTDHGHDEGHDGSSGEKKRDQGRWHCREVRPIQRHRRVGTRIGSMLGGPPWWCCPQWWKWAISTGRGWLGESQMEE
eukprot:5601185-Ditylum_brightwellii.AAC.1